MALRISPKSAPLGAQAISDSFRGPPLRLCEVPGVVMESIVETKAATMVQLVQGLRGDLHVTFEEGTGRPGYTTC